MIKRASLRFLKRAGGRIAIITAFALVMGAGAVWAHEGHAHKVMGTITTRHDTQLEVKTTEGKTVTVTLNDKTNVFRGKSKVDVGTVKEGERVVIDVGDGKEPLTAREIRLGAATPGTK
jgi:hypothetical protein